MCSLSPFSSPLSLNISRPTQKLNHHSPTNGSHVRWSTPLTHVRVIPARESDPAPPTAKVNIPQFPSQCNNIRTIARTMEGLGLTTTSGASTKLLQVVQQPMLHFSSPPHSQPVSTSQDIPQSYPQTVIPNLNLRFIAAHYQADGPQHSPNNSDKNSIGTKSAEPKTAFETGNETLPTTSPGLESRMKYPHAVDTPSSDDIDQSVTFDSGEEIKGLQKHPRNQDSAQKVNTTKRRVIDIDESCDSDGPRNLKRRKGTSHADSNMERHTEAVVLDGPKSIAHAFNNVIMGNHVAVHVKPAPRQALERQPTNKAIGVLHAVRAGTSNAVATSSKVRVEEMEDAEDTEDNDDEDISMELVMEPGDTQRVHVHASMVSRKVSRWADKLEQIHQAWLGSLFDEKIAPIPAREVLELLKDISEHKNWATRIEVEDVHLEQLLDDLVRQDDVTDESDAHKFAVRILDNFAQRFRGARYPPGRR